MEIGIFDEVTSMSILNLQEFLQNLRLTATQEAIGHQILKEIRARVGFLVDVGLDYLSLSRERLRFQAVRHRGSRLATQIGSASVGVAYILDEPSIGLHQRDNDKLLKTLCHLRDLGNSLLSWNTMRILCGRPDSIGYRTGCGRAWRPSGGDGNSGRADEKSRFCYGGFPERKKEHLRCGKREESPRGSLVIKGAAEII